MQKLGKIIGQRDAVKQINTLIETINHSERHGENFYTPVVKLGGLSGLGKSFLAEAVAEAAGRQIIECPIKAGWTWFSEACKLTTSEDDEGNTSPIPATIYVDEAHAQPTLKDMFKKLIEKDNQVVRRNGKTWHSNLKHHLWMLASNEMMDKALERRCEFRLELVPYSKTEKIQLLERYLKEFSPGVELEEEAVKFLESRVKPTAADCKTVAKNSSIHHRSGSLCLKKARDLVSTLGRFNLGLDRREIRAMERLQNNTANVQTLRYVMELTGTSGEKDVKDRMGWLCSFGLATQESATNYAITKDGKNYLDKLKKDIAEFKAKKQATVELPA